VSLAQPPSPERGKADVIYIGLSTHKQLDLAIAAHLDAAARKDPRARGARALSGLLDEPRLAHPGLATKKHHRRIP
jgi:hypothetical protein